MSPWFWYWMLLLNLGAMSLKGNPLRAYNAMFVIGIGAGFAGVYWNEILAFVF